MPRRGQDGGAARAGAATNVPNPEAILRADQHDGRVLTRLRREHYTRVPLCSEFPADVVLVLVVRSSQGSFTRWGFDETPTPEQTAQLLVSAQAHIARFDARYGPGHARSEA